MTVVRTSLGTRLRLQQKAAAALFPTLPRGTATELETTLVLPCGGEYSVKAAWIGKRHMGECNIIGEGWRAARTKLGLAAGDSITVRVQPCGDVLRLHVARAGEGVQQRGSQAGVEAQASAAEEASAAAEQAVMATTPGRSCGGIADVGTATSPVTPQQQQRNRHQRAALGPAVPLLLEGDSVDLQIPLDAVEALGLGGRRGSVRVTLVLMPITKLLPVTLDWHERPADGARFLRARVAQKTLRWHFAVEDGPCQVSLAPEVENTAYVQVRKVDTPSPSGSSGQTAVGVGGPGGADETVASGRLSGKKRKRRARRAAVSTPSSAQLNFCAAAAAAASNQPVPAALGGAQSSDQHTLILTVPKLDRSCVVIPQAEARAASLSGDLTHRAVFSPELGREVMLRTGWVEGTYRMCGGWRALVTAMGLRRGDKLLITVANGSVCRIERRKGAAVAVTSAARTIVGNAARRARAACIAEATQAPQIHRLELCAGNEGASSIARC